MVFLSPLIAVITSITPKHPKGKAIRLEIDDGEGLAMPTNNECAALFR
jgi:hypothetical protein